MKVNGWKLAGMGRKSDVCEHCGRELRRVYIIRHDDGRVMTCGRVCVKKVTGWTLELAEVDRVARKAETERVRAANWDAFAQRCPEDAALIERDLDASKGLRGEAAVREVRLEIVMTNVSTGRADHWVRVHRNHRSGFAWAR